MVSLSGSCLCKDQPIKIKVEGEPSGQGICYCRPCRKLSANLGHIGAMFTEDQVTVEDPAGKTKEWVNDATDSGCPNVFLFCKDCSVMYGNRPAVAKKMAGIDMFVVRQTVLDDTDEWQKLKPTRAQYKEQDIGWYADVCKL